MLLPLAHVPLRSQEFSQGRHLSRTILASQVRQELLYQRLATAGEDLLNRDGTANILQVGHQVEGQAIVAFRKTRFSLGGEGVEMGRTANVPPHPDNLNLAIALEQGQVLSDPYRADTQHIAYLLRRHFAVAADEVQNVVAR